MPPLGALSNCPYTQGLGRPAGHRLRKPVCGRIQAPRRATAAIYLEQQNCLWCFLLFLFVGQRLALLFVCVYLCVLCNSTSFLFCFSFHTGPDGSVFATFSSWPHWLNLWRQIRKSKGVGGGPSGAPKLPMISKWYRGGGERPNRNGLLPPWGLGQSAESPIHHINKLWRQTHTLKKALKTWTW